MSLARVIDENRRQRIRSTTHQGVPTGLSLINSNGFEEKYVLGNNLRPNLRTPILVHASSNHVVDSRKRISQLL